jgi:hypothetical protein
MPVVGSQEDLALSGWDEAPADGPLFALGEVEASSADVRFAGAGAGRLIAPHGEGLWRRAPWPVRDELFALPPAADPDAVLVVAASAEAIATGLNELGAHATTARRLTLDALRAAAVVVLVADTGVFPDLGMCVLAARRVLVTGDAGPCFGLQSGIEFLGVATADEAVERAHLARVYPRATAAMKAMGARAAREHRASLVYPRLTADLQAASSA